MNLDESLFPLLRPASHKPYVAPAQDAAMSEDLKDGSDPNPKDPKDPMCLLVSMQRFILSISVYIAMKDVFLKDSFAIWIAIPYSHASRH